MKLFKKLFSAFCAVVLLFSAVPQAFAQTSPTLYFSNITLSAGGYSVWCYLRMSNAENISAMDYIITYDAENLEFVNYVKQGFTSQSDVTMSVNSAEAGKIHVTLISQNGLNGSDILNPLSFKAKANAKPGTYQISVLVNDIYNTALETVIAEKQSGTITVREGSPTVKNVYFSDSLSAQEIKVGESVDYKLNISSLNGLSAGAFDFYYDDTRLELENVILSDALGKTVYDVNTKTKGIAKLSFASEKAITSGYNAVTLKFSAISDGTAEIRFKANELYDSEFVGMTGNELTKSVKITQPEQVIDYPDLKIVLPKNIPSDKEFSASVVLEGNSGVRAGDFTVTYDKNTFECLGVSAGNLSGAWVTTDKKFNDGQIRFSLMSNIDFSTDTILVTFKLKSKENKNSKSSISVSGTSVYDRVFEKVTLEYVGAGINAVRPEYTVNFYDTDDKTLLLTQKVMSENSAVPPKTDEIRRLDKNHHLKFSGWDKEYSVISDNTDFTAVYEKEAHTEVGMPDITPTYDTPGGSGGKICSVCGATLKEHDIQIPPTGPVIEAVRDSNGKIKITGGISDSETTQNAVLLGISDGKKLLKFMDISSHNQNDLDIEIENIQNADTVKIFRWNNLTNMKPLYDTIEAKIR